MVHRPRYRAWSWPKGKAEPGEPIVVAAVREVEEETGIAVILGVPLATQRYRLGSGHTKEVHYWVGAPVPAGSVAERLRAPVVPAPRGEIDQIRWARPDAAEAMLTRRGDRRLLSELASHARAGTLLTTAVALVRPGDAAGPGAPGRGGTAQGTAALVRANTDEEALVPPGASAAASGAGAAAPTAGAAASGAALVRPAVGGEPATSGEGMLSRLGVRRAFDLVELMSAFGVDRAYAARADRARRTLAPWAAAGGGQVLVAEGEAPRGPTTAGGAARPRGSCRGQWPRPSGTAPRDRSSGTTGRSSGRPAVPAARGGRGCGPAGRFCFRFRSTGRGRVHRLRLGGRPRALAARTETGGVAGVRPRRGAGAGHRSPPRGDGAERAGNAPAGPRPRPGRRRPRCSPRRRARRHRRRVPRPAHEARCGSGGRAGGGAPSCPQPVEAPCGPPLRGAGAGLRGAGAGG